MRWPDLTFRPISRWPGTMTPEGDRRRSPFRAPWDDTIDRLDLELHKIGAERVVLEIDIEERDLRIDGKPRANARAGHPGVILSIGSSAQGPLRFATDRFDRWQDNLRAIALGMEALRKVERYGIVSAGEQYAGWRQLPASTDGDAERIRVGRQFIQLYGLTKALKITHPDHGGRREDFEAVMAAREGS